MATARWVYDKATARFLYGGFYEPTFDAATQGVASFSDQPPDPALERFDGTSPTQRRPATSAELQADATAAVAAQADSDVAVRRVKALIAWTLRRLLGRNPTGAELQAAIAEYKTVYTNLP